MPTGPLKPSSFGESICFQQDLQARLLSASSFANTEVLPFKALHPPEHPGGKEGGLPLGVPPFPQGRDGRKPSGF